MAGYERKEEKMIEPWIENPDEESVIIGRTQACEFIGKLKDEWENTSEKYREEGYNMAADIFKECAEALEAKIEAFTEIK